LTEAAANDGCFAACALATPKNTDMDAIIFMMWLVDSVNHNTSAFTTNQAAAESIEAIRRKEVVAARRIAVLTSETSVRAEGNYPLGFCAPVSAQDLHRESRLSYRSVWKTPWK
jgi:hypothetical protein